MESTEFRRSEFRTLYEAIKTLRSDWLDPRGGPKQIVNAATPVVGVFVEGDSHGYAIEKLNDFLVSDVASVRRIPAAESMSNYGQQWAWGGIVVTRVRR